MAWQVTVWSWLMHAAIGGFLLLAIGGVAAACCRQPAYRLRLIQWTMLGCLLLPLLSQIPGVPRLALGVFTLAPQEATAPSQNSNASDTPLASPPRSAERAAPVALADANEVPAVTNVQQTARHLPAPSHHDASSLTVDRSTANSGVTAEQPAVTMGIGIWAVAAIAVYLLLVVLQAAWWLVGYCYLLKLRLRTSPVSNRVHQLFLEVAGPQARHVRMYASSDVDAPITWGLLRPVIALPQSMCERFDVAELRYCLAHEWSHIERRDVPTMLLALLTQLVCFYQPLFWWLRRQLALCQDFLADARAAAQADCSADYAAYLVQLARRRMSAAPLGALGIADRRSRLFQRVTMLIQSAEPLHTRCRRSWETAVTLTALLLLLTFSAIRLDAARAVDDEPARAADSAAEDAPAQQEQPSAAKPAPPAAEESDEGRNADGSITYRGQVIDRITKKPIAGAVVEIEASLYPDPETQSWRTLATTNHTTDDEGYYTFTLPPEQVKFPSLYLQVDARHPQYACKGQTGYSHTMIRKNLKLGERPFFELIKLNPGKSITATVVNPDGSPAANVRVMSYSKAPVTEPGISFEFGAFDRTRTDENGRFELVIATPGGGIFWLFPDDFAPSAHLVPDERGDLGRLTLVDGPRPHGRVLDAQGRPVKNVPVSFDIADSTGPVADFLQANAVGDSLGRSALTDEDGRFQLGALPPGSYRLEISTREHYAYSGDRHKEYQIDDVFLPQTVTLTENERAPQLDIQAAPHVMIRGTFLDSSGKPRTGHALQFLARINGTFFSTQSNDAGADGKFELKAPHGAERAVLHLITNEHSSLRWRIKPDEPLQFGRDMQLGTIEQDILEIEVVRYVAPVLLIKVVDAANQPLDDFKVTAAYKADEGRRATYIHFDAQQDGRWRSSQLLPDEPVTVQIEKAGYNAEPQTLSLAEKEEREIVFTLSKSAP